MRHSKRRWRRPIKYGRRASFGRCVTHLRGTCQVGATSSSRRERIEEEAKAILSTSRCSGTRQLPSRADRIRLTNERTRGPANEGKIKMTTGCQNDGLTFNSGHSTPAANACFSLFLETRVCRTNFASVFLASGEARFLLRSHPLSVISSHHVIAAVSALSFKLSTNHTIHPSTESGARRQSAADFSSGIVTELHTSARIISSGIFFNSISRSCAPRSGRGE